MLFVVLLSALLVITPKVNAEDDAAATTPEPDTTSEGPKAGPVQATVTTSTAMPEMTPAMMPTTMQGSASAVVLPWMSLLLSFLLSVALKTM